MFCMFLFPLLDAPVKEFQVMTNSDDPAFKNNKSAALLELAEVITCLNYVK